MSSEQRTSSFIFLKQRLMPFSSEAISASSSGQITCAPKFSVHPLKREHLGLPIGLNWKRQAVRPPLPSLSACRRGRSAGQSQRLKSRRDQGFFPPRSPRGQGQQSRRDSGRGGVSPVCAARGPPRPRRLASRRSPPWPLDCSRPGMSPVLSTRSRATPFHPISLQLQGSERPVPSRARDRHLRQLQPAAISERPPRGRLCPHLQRGLNQV